MALTQEAAIRSREEDEELQRSTKKVKESHRANAMLTSTPHNPEGSQKSYKERLIGEIPGHMRKPLGLKLVWTLRWNLTMKA